MFRCEDELFECCNISFDVLKSEDMVQYNWLIKLVPTDPDLKEIVLRHDLFKKEMLIHEIVVPEFKKYVSKKKGIVGQYPTIK